MDRVEKIAVSPRNGITQEGWLIESFGEDWKRGRERGEFFLLLLLRRLVKRSGKKKKKKTQLHKNQTKQKKTTHDLLLAAATAVAKIGSRLPHRIHHGNRRSWWQPTPCRGRLEA